MLFRAVFDDNSFVEGDRTFKCRWNETWGTHHLIVRNTNSPEYLVRIGDEVGIPVVKPKYWVMVKRQKRK